MAQVKYSIITPIHIWNDYRAMAIKRAMKSIENQTFSHYRIEHIVINDGSPREVKVPNNLITRKIDKANEERIVAYNVGMKEAKGEYICFLDSDDEYDPLYLERVDYHFRHNPEYKMVNFGCTMIHFDGGTAQREAFKPKKLEIGHEVFGGGNIVNGTFVFHRSIYDDLGGFPPRIMEKVDCTEINYGTKYGVEQPRTLNMWSPYDFSAAAQMEFPEIRQFFFVDHVNEPNKIIKELGNPWGNDYYLFYKYTRKYHSLPFDEYLLKVHIKKGVE